MSALNELDLHIPLYWGILGPAIGLVWLVISLIVANELTMKREMFFPWIMFQAAWTWIPIAFLAIWAFNE